MDSQGMSSPDSLQSAGRSKKIACIECRQQKVKCDAYERQPDACTRCVKRSLQCSIQMDFKRTYKRARLAAVEKQVEELKRSLEMQSAELQSTDQDMVSHTLLDLARGSSDSRQSTTRPTPAMSPRSRSASPRPRQRTPVPAAPAYLSLDPARIAPQTLAGVTVKPAQIAALMREFETRYHPYFPLVDLLAGPDKIYERSDLLFWIVLSTASRVYADGALYQTLQPVVAELFKTCLSVPLRGVYDVQAALVFSVWAPPSGSLNADLAWTTCGTAMFNAVKLGLHCPGRMQDFGRVKIDQKQVETREQVKTWVCCNIVSQMLAMALGMPTFTLYDWTIYSAALRPNIKGVTPFDISIPRDLRTQVMLAKFCDKMVRLLNMNVNDSCGNVDSSSRELLIPVLAKELHETVQIIGAMSDVSNMLLHVVWLQLYAYAFLDEDPERHVGLLVHAYKYAIKLVSIMDGLDSDDGELGLGSSAANPAGERSRLAYLPVYVDLDVALAAFVLLRLQFSPMADLLDANAGKRHFASAISILRKASVRENDFPYRISAVLFQLWKLFAKDQAETRKPHTVRLKLRTRMATSIIYDSIWVWRERYGNFPQNPNAVFVPSAGEQDNTPATGATADGDGPAESTPSGSDRVSASGERLALTERSSVMELLDSSNADQAHGAYVTGGGPRDLPSPSVRRTMSATATPVGDVLTSQSSAVHTPALPHTPGAPTPAAFTAAAGLPGIVVPTAPEQFANVGTDDVVSFLDNDNVAVDHFYIDLAEADTLFEDINLFTSGMDYNDYSAAVPDGPYGDKNGASGLPGQYMRNGMY
ncbi:uncharacterized protein V1510DRAFT_431496 [Dipodascopsis tothii]|uniref:uncharacterized protein n=1 Tax=Dipodascopsis tothii TaxID=44089 RepID=UPI0034CEB4F9